MSGINLDFTDVTQILSDATRNAFAGNVDSFVTECFLKKMPRFALDETGLHVPCPPSDAAPVLSADASILAYLIYSQVTCRPTDPPYNVWGFNASAWGVGAGGGTSKGIMYTTYNNWDAFFRNVAGYHVQGIAELAGILQISWFNGSAVPVGQFNGVLAGAGVFEFGGKGTWKK